MKKRLGRSRLVSSGQTSKTTREPPAEIVRRRSLDFYARPDVFFSSLKKKWIIEADNRSAALNGARPTDSVFDNGRRR